MSNWCFSRVTVKAPKPSIDRIESEMEAAMSADPYHTDFGEMWLGNLLGHIGMLDASGRGCDLRYRGWVDDFQRTDEREIELSTESAWGPHISCIQAFARHYAPEAEVLYDAEETGCGLFWTNDPEMIGRVRIEAFDVEGVPEELYPFESWDYCEESSLISRLQGLLATDEADLDALVAAWNEKLQAYNPEATVYVNPFVYVEVGEET